MRFYFFGVGPSKSVFRRRMNSVRSELKAIWLGGPYRQVCRLCTFLETDLRNACVPRPTAFLPCPGAVPQEDHDERPFCSMRKLVAGIAVFLTLVAGVFIASGFRREPRSISPWARLPQVPAHFDHADIIQGPFTSGPEVTARCLACHPDSAKQVMKTSHWTWASQKVKLPGRDEIIRVGKRNLLNNFCIHAGPNMQKCSSCHAGYGWEDDHFDFAAEENVDCLVCHDQTNTYEKGPAGHPNPDVDLVHVASYGHRCTDQDVLGLVASGRGRS
jgi:hypothetical protein